MVPIVLQAIFGSEHIFYAFYQNDLRKKMVLILFSQPLLPFYVLHIFAQINFRCRKSLPKEKCHIKSQEISHSAVLHPSAKKFEYC